MEWINVKERLPEIKQKVLFVAKANHRLAYLNGEVMAGKFGCLEDGVALFTAPGIGIEGTHWMPLSDPPADSQSTIPPA